MRIDETEFLKKLSPEKDLNAYDFYRCQACKRLLTRIDELKFFARVNSDLSAPDARVDFCPCLSRRFSPSFPNGLGEWLNPRIIYYTLKLIAARVVAPFMERRAPFVVPLLERFVRS